MRRYLLLILLLIGSVANAQTTADDYGIKAYNLLMKKKPEEALKFYDKAIDLKPDTPAYYFDKAYCYFMMGNKSKANDQIENSLKIFDDNILAYNAASVFYMLTLQHYSNLDVWNSAYKKFATAHDTVRIRVYNRRGYAMFDLQNFKGARDSYLQALKIDTAYIDTWYNLASVYDDLDKADSSIYYYNKIITKEPEGLTYYNNLGFLYNKLGRYDDAIALFGKALKRIANDKNKQLDENNFGTHGLLYSNRGYAYYKTGKYKDALKDFDESIKLYSTNSYVYKNRALVYIAQKKFDEACKDLNYAIALSFADQYGTEVDELLDKYCR